MSILYTTTGTATGGREGSGAIEGGSFSVTLSTPKELGGGGGSGTNPEQLFALGYAACFLSAIKFVAGQDKVALDPSSTVTTTVGVGPRDDGKGFGLDVKLQAHLPGLERAKAEDLVARAHIVCPYSHATKDTLHVTPTVA